MRGKLIYTGTQLYGADIQHTYDFKVDTAV